MPRSLQKARVDCSVQQQQQQSISTFARISKGQTYLEKKSIKAAGKNTMAASRKRKAAVTSDDDDEPIDKQPSAAKRRNVLQPVTAGGRDNKEGARPKRTCRRDDDTQLLRTETPQKSAANVVKGKRTAKAAPSRTATAHKPAVSTVIGKSKQQTRTIQTQIESYSKKFGNGTGRGKDGEDGSSQEFPPHLAELVRLHKAFLKTVMLHFAHSGSNVPLDIRTLAPDIARSWGKRRVTIEDIRRCVAIQSSAKLGTTSPFVICDYGQGRVCVELSEAAHEAGSISAVNEAKLCGQFEANLRELCAARSGGAAEENEDMDVDIPLEGLSLGDLPQVAVTDMEARSTAARPHLAKGQRALTELKNGIAAKQQEKEAKELALKTASSTSQNTALNPDGTKMSLLDRLRLKQLARADAPLPPSGPELQRLAALGRVPDVAATISMLSLSNPISLPRQAFTMSVILDKLKDSLRVPVSREEGMLCVKLIAAEVAPEWLRVVAIGGRENVVVQRNAQPVDRIIQERVEKLRG